VRQSLSAITEEGRRGKNCRDARIEKKSKLIRLKKWEKEEYKVCRKERRDRKNNIKIALVGGRREGQTMEGLYCTIVRRARKIFTKAGLHMKRAQKLHHEKE
jgi:hypothetical protein